MSDMELQEQREKRAAHSAQAKALDNIRQAVEAGDVDRLPRSTAVVSRLYAMVKEQLTESLQGDHRGSAKARYDWLRALDIDVLSVLVIRNVIFNTLRNGDKATVQRLAVSLGMAIFQEVRLREAEKVNPLYVERTWAYLKNANTTSNRHINKTMKAVIRNILPEDYQELTNTEYLHIGKIGINVCIEVGILESSTRYTKKGTLKTFKLVEPVYKALTEHNPMLIRTRPVAMVCPPVPWEDTLNGGYLTWHMRKQNPIMPYLGMGRSHTNRLRRHLIEQSKRPLEVINYLQSVPFVIHEPTWDVFRSLWEDGGGALGVPSRVATPKPEYPFTDSLDKDTATAEELETLSNWKRATNYWHTCEVRRKSGFVEQAELVRGVRELIGRDIYFPMMYDFRGRMYYRGTPNPQGSDVSKALVHFAEKRPLGERGLFWLKVQLANAVGYDKTRFEDRAAFVDRNWENFLAGIQYPMDSDVFRNADEPFVAVAAAKEIAAALSHPEGHRNYRTGNPVHMDATCSGLQHFSAMLRDPVGGESVNLYDTGGLQKSDIYARVAERVQAEIDYACSSPLHPNYLEARLWSSIGIERKLAKKPTMTYVYGVTLRGVSDYVSQYLDEIEWSFKDVSTGQMSAYMAKVMFKSIAEAVPAAAECMAWLRNLINHVDTDDAIYWTSPVGFPVVQEYLKFKEKRVRIRSCGMQYVVVKEKTNDNKLDRMRNAICPNFIHSMDAAHLAMVAEAMRDKGHHMVSIHDSIGTHPSEVDTLHAVIREQFCKLYTDYNPLKSLTESLGVSVDLPEMGDLDVSEVLSSEFFFC